MASWRLILPVLFLLGCNRSQNEIVLYSSVDEPYTTPVIQDFMAQTGIRVRLVTDTEASKSVGLAERLRAEKNNPQADVWWDSEPFNTIMLAEEKVLAPYNSPSAADVLPMYRDPDHRWTGNALRARVMAASPWATSSVLNGSIENLVDPRLKDRIAIARPTAGTTGGHVAALYAIWGESKTDDFLRKLRDNGVKMLGGNSVVAETVSNGTVWAGLSDNDDVASVIREGGKLESFLPNQNPGDYGTLLIPTTVSLVAGAQNSDGAKKLIDYLLSSQVEQKLIAAKFCGWSVRSGNDVRAMQIDYVKVADSMPQAVNRATAILEGRE